MSHSDPEVTYVDVPINLPDDVLLKLALMAHEQDITLNEFCRKIVREELDKLENEHSLHSQDEL